MIIKGAPEFKTDKELFDWIVENEETIFAQAKSSVKHAEPFGHLTVPMKDGISLKAEVGVEVPLIDRDVLSVKAIINTTNLLDSHKDVHIDGLWDKSLSEKSRRILHVQEHKSYEFDKIISSGSDLKAYVETVTWKSLGYDMEGKTQALVFDSKVRKDRNKYMHEQYARKFVDNHSVGMIYVKMATCINDEDYPVQKENWDKYASLVANKADLEMTKYFWAILEAKCVEGSAVPNGSNWATPTSSVSGADKDTVENKVEKLEESPLYKWLNDIN